MVHKSFVLYFFALAITVELIPADSYELCPKEEDAIKLLGTCEISTDAEPFTKRIRSGRLPPVGFYDEIISCVSIVDLTNGEDPGKVEVVNGGIHARYVDVKVTSQLGHKFSYTVQAFSKGDNLRNSSKIQ